MDTEVLVVGAGPTGLTLACELRRHGVACRVVDKLEAPVTYSKAAAVHARTLEVFDDIGVVDAFLGVARAIHGARIHSRGELVGHVRFAGIDSAYPAVYGASQRDTERVLTERLEVLGGAVERRFELVSLENGPDGVTATLAGPSGNEVVRARWLVGCDGAHSTVRKQLGCTFEGGSYEEHLVQADVRVDLPDPGTGDEILAFLSPRGPLAMFPLFKDGRYRVIGFLPPDAPDEEPTLELFQRMLDERGPAGTRVHDPAWMVPFRIHCRRTDRYRDRSVFLAGDAAHIHSPAGGQGMNTGIQDAYNLAWKLALASRGRGGERLVDSYEAERMPIAKQLLSTTDAAQRGMSTVASLENALVTGLRDQIIGFVTGLSAFRQQMGKQISMLGLNYRGSPIVAEDRRSVLFTNVTSGAPDEAPGLKDWAAFGDGPEPGDRAPEVTLAGGSRWRRVGELLRTTKHTLLLFDGAAATEQGYANLGTIAARAEEKWGDALAAHVIVPAEKKPDALKWGSVVLDADRAMHARYGARSECLYLVRPDGYVGYRAQPARWEQLEAWLTAYLG